MPMRMRGTNKIVRSVHTEQTYDHTVHTEWINVHSVATVKTCYVCAVTMSWAYHVSWLHSFNTLRMHLSRGLLSLDILIFVKDLKSMISRVAFWNTK